MNDKARRKRVVIHEDDLGMTHGANAAFVELSALGACSSGSVMVPCPWFPEVAAIAERDPALDLGVHLTLTSEQKPYRWRPLTAPSAAAGLTDDAGYFWPDVPSVRRSAAPEAVEAELRAQIDTALAAGIDVTHLDDHMGVVLMPEFIDIYRRLGRDYRLPILLVKDFSRFHPASYSGPFETAHYDAEVAAARGEGNPIFEVVFETPWTRTTDAETAYRAIFAGIPDGLTYLALHFNTPGDFEVIAPDLAHIRTEEYALFRTARRRMGRRVRPRGDLDARPARRAAHPRRVSSAFRAWKPNLRAFREKAAAILSPSQDDSREVAMGPVLGQLSYPLDLVALEREGATPLHLQLGDQLRTLILNGDIRAQSRLPSTRTIARELGISRNTVLSALDQLGAEGLLESQRGSGIRVARGTQAEARDRLATAAPKPTPSLSARGQLMAAQPRVVRSRPAPPFTPGPRKLPCFRSLSGAGC